MRIAHTVRLLLTAAAVLACTACSGDDPASPSPDSGKIRTGEFQQVLDQSVSPGGTATVSAGGTAVDGLTLEVPAGAYASATQVRISFAGVTGHDFGAQFDPVTPLIRIENGGDFAAVPMRLRIPLPDLGGRFPVAFYYDRAAGTLEAIAPVGRSATWLDVAVRHFSEIVVSATQIQLLRDGGGFHTFFDPQVNGWSFVNYGCYPEPGGICAGMSIGAAHFYRNFSASLLVSSHFDNERYWFQTPKLWEDDASGIKFCGELQTTFVSANSFWIGGGGTPFDGFLSRSETDQFWSLCYALLVVNQPQILYLAVKGNAAAPAHAILAYAYEISGDEGRLKVYDPNYPGSEGTIYFDIAAGKFRPYTTAGNARALEEGSTFAYDQIVFIPLSTLCDEKDIRRIWQKVGTKSVGDGQYPSYELWAVPVGNEELPRVKLLDATTGKTTFLPYREFTVEIVPSDKSVPFSLTGWIDLPDIGEVEKREPAGTITLERPSKDNLVGIQVNAKAAQQNHFSWVGFHWFKLRLQSLWIEPADTVVGMGQELTLVARHNRTAPAGARFEWDFGDDGTETRTGDSTVTHVFEKAGEFDVRVVMYAPGSSEPAGSAQCVVHVSEFRTLAITLRGMDTTPPSTIKTKDGSDIPSMSWSNKIGAAPPITWNKKEFTVEYSYTMSRVDWHTRISGRLSDDGKSIAVLTAITTGYGYDGAYQHSATIALTNFPVEVVPKAPMGSTLTGAAGQPKVSAISWRQASVDGSGNTHVSELGTINWSSDQTELSVYFYR